MAWFMNIFSCLGKIDESFCARVPSAPVPMLNTEMNSSSAVSVAGLKINAELTIDKNWLNNLKKNIQKNPVEF